jgi:CheY-like chemotaxis protein
VARTAQALNAMFTLACSLLVLDVDDHPDTRDSFRILLTYWGHDVLSAACGAEALTAAVAFRPHVLSIDLSKPEVNGYETARRLREQPALVGVLLVPVRASPGFNPHLVKSVELDGFE